MVGRSPDAPRGFRDGSDGFHLGGAVGKHKAGCDVCGIAVTYANETVYICHTNSPGYG